MPQHKSKNIYWLKLLEILFYFPCTSFVETLFGILDYFDRCCWYLISKLCAIFSHIIKLILTPHNERQSLHTKLYGLECATHSFCIAVRHVDVCRTPRSVPNGNVKTKAPTRTTDNCQWIVVLADWMNVIWCRLRVMKQLAIVPSGTFLVSSQQNVSPTLKM